MARARVTMPTAVTMPTTTPEPSPVPARLAPASAPILAAARAAAPDALVAVGRLRVSATRSPKARRALVVGGRLKPAAGPVGGDHSTV
jgi:hypothetical protein